MIVAGIETVATGKVKPSGRLELNQHQLFLEKGAELGRFYLGSTAIVLFEENKMQWDAEFKANSVVEMGRKLGGFCFNFQFITLQLSLNIINICPIL